jgi:hypothetical protein
VDTSHWGILCGLIQNWLGFHAFVGLDFSFGVPACPMHRGTRTALWALCGDCGGWLADRRETCHTANRKSNHIPAISDGDHRWGGRAKGGKATSVCLFTLISWTCCACHRRKRADVLNRVPLSIRDQATPRGLPARAPGGSILFPDQQTPTSKILQKQNWKICSLIVSMLLKGLTEPAEQFCLEMLSVIAANRGNESRVTGDS